MDPLSVSVGLVAAISQITTTISILSDIRDGPEDVGRLILELSSTSGLLQSLRSLGEKRQEEAEWPKIWRSLLSSGGAILELNFALADFTRSLSSARDLRQTKSRLTWHFQRTKRQKLLEMVKAANSVIAVSLTASQL